MGFKNNKNESISFISQILFKCWINPVFLAYYCIEKEKNGLKSQKSFYKEGIRHKIIDDGISFVNMIAADTTAVLAFGDDIIQFFYDISISSTARDRQKPLMFAEAMTHKYVELLNRSV